MINNQWKTALIAVASSIVTVVGYNAISAGEKNVFLNEAPGRGVNSLVNYANMPVGQPGDFTFAAGTAAPAVVHIKAKAVRQVRQRMPSIFDDFFGFDDNGGGMRSQQQESSGSGVIISADGYIATNNHVVEGAEELEVVTYDKRAYTAKVIGTDPSTDIAVIKIEETKLPAIVFGNSDDAKVGEWVLAVGNPFNLESTVTAGIISAIGRDISILKNKMQMQRSETQRDSPIESFIQTDAAVNPGNSGGALVNLNGELIGINTAIASPNGAYAGYAFAVPSSIVKKVTMDLVKFGNVQRGYLGIEPIELNNKNYKELDAKLTTGIFVNSVTDKGAANAAGVKQGDVIIKVDGIDTKSEPKFRELIGRKRPGEKVAITVNRDGAVKNFDVVLKNFDGGSGIVKREVASAFDKLGIQLEELSAKEKEKIGVRNGVRITAISGNGFIARDTEDIKEGFIITRIGNIRVNSVADVKNAIAEAKKQNEEGVLMCGVYEGLSRNFCEGVAID